MASEQLYAYARSNPFVFGDPLGLEAEENGDGSSGEPRRRVSVGSIVGGAAAPRGVGGPVNGINEMSNAVVSSGPRLGETTVELRYTATDVPVAHHAFVVLTSPDGAQFYSRGGPRSQIDGPGSPRVSSGGGVFGTIYARSGAYVPGTIDYTTEPAASMVVLRSTDPGAFDKYRNELIAFEESVNGAEITYNALNRNSNSFAHQAIEALGLPRPAAPVWAPGDSTVLRTRGDE